MGCLLELFFEIFVEGIFELICHCYIKLMTLIVPNKIISPGVQKVIKGILSAIAALLGIALVIGLILRIQDDPDIRNIGKYMTNIPLTIMAVQIVLGIVVKIFTRKKQ